MAPSPSLPPTPQIDSIDALMQGFESFGYIADSALATAIYLDHPLAQAAAD